MEFKWSKCDSYIEKGTAQTQLSVNEDYVVRDNKPDVLRVLHGKGKVEVEEVKAANKMAWITGKLCFEVLYRSDDPVRKVECLKGEVPFQEKIRMDSLEEQDRVKAYANLEDLTIGILNSRKLEIRAVICLEALVEQSAVDVWMERIEGESGVEQKIEECQMLALTFSGEECMRVKKELNLPASKGNLETLLFQNVELRKKEITPENGGIRVTGEVYVAVLYANEEQQLEWYEGMFPLDLHMQAVSVMATDLFCGKGYIKEVKVEAARDEDAEARRLQIEVLFEVRAQVWREQSYPVLKDAYALDKELVLSKDKMKMKQLVMKNETHFRLNEQVELGGYQESIMQIVSYSAKVVIEKTEPVPGGLLVHGALEVVLIYMTSEDDQPIGQECGYLPFSQLVELPEMSADMKISMDAGVEQLQVNLLDSREYEVKAAIAISVCVIEVKEICVISNITEAESDKKKWKDAPGMVGYFAQEETPIWDLAKKFHTTVEEICEINGINSENVKVGKKILIVKRVE